MVDLSNLQRSIAETKMTNDELNEQMRVIRDQRRRPSKHAKKKDVKKQRASDAKGAALLIDPSKDMAKQLLAMIEQQGDVT